MRDTPGFAPATLKPPASLATCLPQWMRSSRGAGRRGYAAGRSRGRQPVASRSSLPHFKPKAPWAWDAGRIGRRAAACASRNSHSASDEVVDSRHVGKRRLRASMMDFQRRPVAPGRRHDAPPAEPSVLAAPSFCRRLRRRRRRRDTGAIVIASGSISTPPPVASTASPFGATAHRCADAHQRRAATRPEG